MAPEIPGGLKMVAGGGFGDKAVALPTLQKELSRGGIGKGSFIEVKYESDWWQAVVRRMQGKQVEVRYLGEDLRAGEWLNVTSTKIRLPVGDWDVEAKEKGLDIFDEEEDDEIVDLGGADEGVGYGDEDDNIPEMHDEDGQKAGGFVFVRSRGRVDLDSCPLMNCVLIALNASMLVRSVGFSSFDELCAVRTEGKYACALCWILVFGCFFTFFCRKTGSVREAPPTPMQHSKLVTSATP